MNELTTAASLHGIGLGSSNNPQVFNPGNLNSEQIDQVATEFEGVFVSLLIKELRSTTEGDGFFGSEDSDSFGSMFDLSLIHISEPTRPY